jgi:alpha-amylase/alpha-mannosidase (GH57 family)
MRWINLLHFYQPANIDSFNIKEALDKSYWRLIRLMEEHPCLKMTWNISGCLLNRLKDEGEKEFIVRLIKLINKKQVEITSTAAYHGLLPLLPLQEVSLQIKENEEILQNILGFKVKPTGFFLPEMAYSPAVGKVIKKKGYDWIILDEIAFPNNKKLKNNRYYIDKNSGLKVIFRDRSISTSYPPAKILDLSEKENSQEIIITVTDAELYGLRHEDPTGDMEKIAKKENIITDTISGFIKTVQPFIDQEEPLCFLSSSWDSSLEDIKRKEPFKLWQDKGNPIHKELWILAELAMSLGKKFKQDKNYQWYRWHLVRGLASCTFWWASAFDFSTIFGPYAWNPDIIERGLEDIVRSIRSLESPKSKKYKLQAEKHYLKIKKLIWEEHWQKHWQNRF